jgi:hypothetical protein
MRFFREAVSLRGTKQTALLLFFVSLEPAPMPIADAYRGQAKKENIL